MLFVDENLDDAASAMNDYCLSLDMGKMMCGSTPFEAYGTKCCKEMTDCVSLDQFPFFLSDMICEYYNSTQGKCDGAYSTGGRTFAEELK